MSQPQADYKTEADDALEMLGKGYNEDPVTTEFISTMSGFTPAPDILIAEYGFVTALVWGRAWRFCQMVDGVCRASIEKLALSLGMSERTIIRHMETLCEGGYLLDTTPDLKNRPHIYADTGKIRIRVNVEAGMTLSHSRVTESHRQGDLKSVEESNKKESNKKNPTLSEKDLQQVNAKMDFIINHGQGTEGKNWRGRELLPPQYLPYADWWVSKTCIEMYGAKAKPKMNAEWNNAFKLLYENDVTIAACDASFEANKWRTISKPSQIVTDAIAINALPAEKQPKNNQVEETRKKIESEDWRKRA